jgi:hypothetical protein
MHTEQVGAVSGLSASQHAHFQPALAFGAGAVLLSLPPAVIGAVPNVTRAVVVRAGGAVVALFESPNVNPVDGNAPSSDEKLNVDVPVSDVLPKLTAGAAAGAFVTAALGAPAPGLGRGTMHTEHVGAVSELSASQHAHFQPALAFGAGLLSFAPAVDGTVPNVTGAVVVAEGAGAVVSDVF